ncbi:bifunctional 2-polyprenyl-6-hydroxyphenol methylase/3-demethylubiquinol 3-O-methyltransferase UbiG [Pedobacter sp. UBA4863]|mgnify:CR=1 FL=1|uniref:class I SAM-dependent methyltransferase n=1 Tax=Pedobacter sp. UBA4863 TaxID=1947060 RepID=UPI0025E9E869|nr:class I SAM-dependent methyltransferase [Pedobacter sp. UBA4863]
MLNNDFQTAYQDFYTNNDVAWRMLGAKYKAQNIVEVCKSIQPKKVLEVGAGDGSILHFLNEWNFAPEIYALEIATSGVEKIKARNLPNLKEVQVFDGYKIPYADNSFDLIVLAHVLEHVEHERILIRELKRVAKHMVIEVPRDYKFGVDQRLNHFLAYGHINMYTPTLLRFLLRSEGLEIVADKSSVITPEVTLFNDYVNRKVQKSFLKNLKVKLEYQVKNALGKLLGRQKQEEFANAYTVLVQKSEQDIKIF